MPNAIDPQQANALHRLLLRDPAFHWEGGGDGAYARAVLMVDRLQREGVSTEVIGKILLIHKGAPLRGWQVQTRLAGVQRWTQHVVPTLATTAGTFVLDPMLCENAEHDAAWLTHFGPEPPNPAIPPPTPQFVQTLLASPDGAFRQLLKLAAQRPDSYKHLLSDPAVAARLAQMGTPVRLWLERAGSVPELFDPHIHDLVTAAEQHGPLVRGEVVRVAYGVDFFADVHWDTAGRDGARGVSAAREILDAGRSG